MHLNLRFWRVPSGRSCERERWTQSAFQIEFPGRGNITALALWRYVWITSVYGCWGSCQYIENYETDKFSAATSSN